MISVTGVTGGVAGTFGAAVGDRSGAGEADAASAGDDVGTGEGKASIAGCTRSRLTATLGLAPTQYSSGAVPLRKYSERPPYPGGALRLSPAHTRTTWTSGGGDGKSAGLTFASAAFMKCAQMRAGTLPPYDSYMRE